MANEEQKLSRFKQAVYGEAQQEADSLVETAQRSRDKRLEKVRAEAENYLNTQYVNIDKNCKASAVKEISSQNLRSKRNILLSREEIINRVFENVRRQLEDFTKTEKYEQLLAQRISQCEKLYPNEKGKIITNFRDEESVKKIVKDRGFEVCAGDTVEIGGIMIVMEEKNLVIDYTFDCVFSQLREGFAVKAGLNIYS